MGPPGSGKSTHAKAMEDQGYLRISQDEQGRGHLDIFYSHLSTGRDIVVDRMGFDKQQRDRYRLEAIKNGYTVNFVEFCTPRQICFDRCMARENHQTINGDEKIQDMPGVRSDKMQSRQANNALDTFFSKYEEVLEEEGEILRVYWNASEKTSAIMVDLDGTLCNLDHRIHYVKNGNRDWVSFFRECKNDTLYKDVAGLIEAEFMAGTEIVLCSGRTEDVTREATERWLSQHGIHYNDLVMRPKLNYKRDDITKAMLYRYEIKPYYDIKYVVDDRQQVVDKWRSMGITCFQVRPGDF